MRKQQSRLEAPSREHSEEGREPSEAESPHDSKIALPQPSLGFSAWCALHALREVTSGPPGIRNRSSAARAAIVSSDGSQTHLELAPSSRDAPAPQQANKDKMAPTRPPGARITPLKVDSDSDADDEREADAKAHESFSAERKAMSVKIKNVFGKQIMGGVFAKSPSSYEGVLYKSRVTAIKPEEIEDHWDTGSDHSGDVLERPSHLGEMDDERPPSTAGGLPADMADDVSSADESEPEDMTQRQQLAVTLRNYCKKENNVKHLLDEGAVVALCGLAGLDDDRIRCAVAVALSNLTKRGDYIDALLKAGVMVAVLQLATGLPAATARRQAILKRRREYGIADPAPGSEERRRETAGLRVALHCARTLANMSFCRGGEEAMVADGVVYPAPRLLHCFDIVVQRVDELVQVIGN